MIEPIRMDMIVKVAKLLMIEILPKKKASLSADQLGRNVLVMQHLRNQHRSVLRMQSHHQLPYAIFPK